MPLGCSQKILTNKKRWGSHVLRVLSKIAKNDILYIYLYMADVFRGP
jgi:hypothetical protein